MQLKFQRLFFKYPQKAGPVRENIAIYLRRQKSVIIDCYSVATIPNDYAAELYAKLLDEFSYDTIVRLVTFENYTWSVWTTFQAVLVKKQAELKTKKKHK